MLDLVERNNNNCKYINQHCVQIKSLKVELLRNPFSFKYKVKINEKEESNEIIINDFEDPWLIKTFDKFQISRKSINSIFLNIKSFFTQDKFTIQYQINSGSDETSQANIDMLFCVVDYIGQMIAIVAPTETISNCQIITDNYFEHQNCCLIGYKNIEDSYILNFEILTSTVYKNDFRIKILNEKKSLIRIKKMIFLVKIINE